MAENQPGSKTPKRQRSSRRWLRPSTLLTLLIIPLVVIVTTWMLLQQFQQSPIRQAAAEIPSFGVIPVEITTDPFPPPATGTVRVTIQLQTSGRRMLPIDRVTYSYGPVDGNEIFNGEAQAGENMAMMFEGPLSFTRPGNWWLKVRLESQGESGEAEFTLSVKPAS